MSIDELGGHPFDSIRVTPNIEHLREMQDEAREKVASDPTLVFVPGTFRRYGEFACCGGCDCPAAQAIEGVLEGEG